MYWKDDLYPDAEKPDNQQFLSMARNCFLIQIAFSLID